MKDSRTRLLALSAFALLAACGSGQEEPDKAEIAAAEPAGRPSESPAERSAETPEPVASPDAGSAQSEAGDPVAGPEKQDKPATTAAEPKDKAETEPAPATAAVAMARPASFGQCAVCHSDKQGQKSGFGPNLFGVAGTRSGELAGYSFSPALKSAGVVWNSATLDRFIEAPQAVVPGTKMAFGGVKDPGKRRELVDYLMSLK